MSKRRTKPYRPPQALLGVIYPGGGFVHGWFFSSFVRTLLEDQEGIFNGRMLLKESGPNLDVNRNYICRRFLNESKEDWLYFSDSDHKWDPQHLFQFIKDAEKEGRQIVSGMYRRLDYTTVPWTKNYAFYDIDGEALGAEFDQETKPKQMQTVPGGALLIHRDALIKIRDEFGPRRKAAGLFEDDLDQDRKIPWLGGENWFTADNGGGMREDTAFCARAAMCEIPIYADPRFQVYHIKSVLI